MILRPYQTKAIEAVRAEWANGSRSVLLVAPTGAGKTVLGKELASRFERVLWVAHRRELVSQTSERLKGHPNCRVVTVQSLVAQDAQHDCDLLVLDEAHHYVADEWRCVVERHSGALCVGLTATPERADGTPLGDIFESIVVAASYSELLAEGFLVHVCVLQPTERLGSDLAQDPLDAWVQHSGGVQSFVFCARVDAAQALARRFSGQGVIAECIEADTPKRERDKIVARFRAGRTRVLTNVGVLTEGVDVPEAGCVVLARAFGHVGAMLQAAGRVLRPSPGKDRATVIDLVGATLRHGLPTEDRDYSLSGCPIVSRDHGSTGASGEFVQDIRGLDLRMVSSLPVAQMKSDALRRIQETAQKKGWGAGFVKARYRALFGEWPNEESARAS